MILSDGEIKAALRRKAIIIDPDPEETQFTTSALDLFLGEEVLELKSADELAKEEPSGVERPLIVDPGRIDVRNMLQKYARPVRREDDGSFILQPNRFTVGITRESVELPRESKIAARVEGRSTLARLGLVVHLTAPTIHAGFAGKIVLEMYNFGNYPLRLRPGRLAICQLIFERLGQVPGKIQTVYMGQKALR